MFVYFPKYLMVKNEEPDQTDPTGRFQLFAQTIVSKIKDHYNKLKMELSITNYIHC